MGLSTLPTNISTCDRSLQVINDVKCVVKELVENSLDADATVIGIIKCMLLFNILS